MVVHSPRLARKFSPGYLVPEMFSGSARRGGRGGSVFICQRVGGRLERGLLGLIKMLVSCILAAWASGCQLTAGCKGCQLTTGPLQVPVVIQLRAGCQVTASRFVGPGVIQHRARGCHVTASGFSGPGVIQHRAHGCHLTASRLSRARCHLTPGPWLSCNSLGTFEGPVSSNTGLGAVI